MAQQQQSKMGSMRPKPIIDKKSPGMDSPVYQTKAINKKYGDHPKSLVKTKSMRANKRSLPKNPSMKVVRSSLKRTMGY